MNIVDELRAQANQHPLDADLIMFDVAATKIDELKQQRDELLAAIKDFRYEMKFKHAIDEANIIGASSRIVLERVDAAIKNAEGE